MAVPEPPFDSAQSFCGNCGTAVRAGDRACPNCGMELDAPVSLTDSAQVPPVDYVPYCRSCGRPVPWAESHSCRKCGVAPLCSEHFDRATEMCSDCISAQAAAAQPDLGPAFDPGTPSSGPWAQARPAVACRNCRARIRQGVRYCPQCGSEQAAGPVTSASGEVEYMGFWVRFAAALIDAVITGAAAAIIDAVIGIPFLGSAISLVYYIVFTGLRGQTPGKMVMRIQVVDANGNIPSWTQVIMRELIGKLISGVVLLLGYFWVVWDARKRGWHDYIGGTFVVRKKRRD